MADREGPSGSGSEEGSTKEIGRSAPQAMPTGSRPRSGHFAHEPLQFRVRGSTITGASPPKLVTLEDIMKLAGEMQNMALAHEIAMDNDFKLEPYEPPVNSIHKIVKDTVHKAFFEILRQELNSDPPVYKQAMLLMEEVKQGLFDVILPRHTRIRERIVEVLDADFIRQQAENNSLDFHKYATFVIDQMAMMAAPARDEMIQNITTITDTTDMFRAILETLEVMKLDLANSLIALIRPRVINESVEYERAKFDHILSMAEDGLEHTRDWLLRNLDKTDLTLPVRDQGIIRNVTDQTLAKAYLELLEWDPANKYPETLSLDAPRFVDLGTSVYRLYIVASLVLVSPSTGDQTTSAQHKQALKEKLYIILDTTSNDIELKQVLPSVAEEVILVTEQLLESMRCERLNNVTKELIRTQILALSDCDHRVRQIVRQRILEFMKTVILCGGGDQLIPAGLTAVVKELTAVTNTLLRYVTHNKAVFNKHYMEIIGNELSKE